MVQKALTTEDVLKCREVVRDLRPHITEESYFTIMMKMIGEGYTLLYIEEDGKAVSFAGFVKGYKLHRGNYIYIDDLNTLPGYRKKGYASLLMDEIEAVGKKENAKEIHLDSGVQRHDAHRFYLSRKFIISSHHFVLK
jgi:GNAT superfamily N-acetyltransferase